MTSRLVNCIINQLIGIIFGSFNTRYDIPKHQIITVGRNVILDIDFPEVDRNLSLPAPDYADDKNEEKKWI